MCKMWIPDLDLHGFVPVPFCSLSAEMGQCSENGEVHEESQKGMPLSNEVL